MKACFRSADIWLPGSEVEMEYWPVVACDQYTSQKQYWEDVSHLIGDKPSTLHMIFPEVYLGEEEEKRIEAIQTAMNSYLATGILKERVKDGFVLAERTFPGGVRAGLVGVIDLEAYDYAPGSHALIRATEGTIESRIPPRVHIREGAALECPHVMVLIDDCERKLTEPLLKEKEKLEKIYDVELMKDGGHLTGYAVTGEKAKQLNELLYDMEQDSDGFFLAVGDGNHSLATAKVCWKKKKKELTPEERKTHPARYALVELVNLHSKALQFEPIHRMLFHADGQEILEAFQAEMSRQSITCSDGNDIVFLFGGNEKGIKLQHTGGRIPVDVLQRFLDSYMMEHPEIQIDYVHGNQALEELSGEEGNCGIRLTSMKKNELFPAIKAGGALPRKTFSMGEAYEKRYYMESRRI